MNKFLFLKACGENREKEITALSPQYLVPLKMEEVTKGSHQGG